MGIIVLLGMTIVLQLMAAVLALRLIRITAKRTGWVLLALAVSTAGAAPLLLLPPGDRWGGARTTSDTGSAWPGHRGILGGRDRVDCSPVCLAQTG